MYPSRQICHYEMKLCISIKGNFRKKAFLGKGRVKKGGISKKKRAQVYRPVAFAGQPTFPCRSHCGSIVTADLSSLWFHRHCGPIVTVDISSLWFHGHGGSMVTVVPWIYRHGGFMDTVVSWTRWFHGYCGSIITAVPWTL